jgi:hypothetical protein
MKKLEIELKLSVSGKKSVSYNNLPESIQKRKYVLRIPFGLDLKIEVDVLFTTDEKILPPFSKGDLECNVLLLNSGKGIFLSPQTGSFHFDGFRTNVFTHKKMEVDIINDIIVRKTECLERDCGCDDEDIDDERDHFTKSEISSRNLTFERHLSMLVRGWDVGDLEIKIVAKTSDEKDICVICQDLVSCTQIVSMKCCKAFAHTDCFRKYIRNEHSNRITPRCFNICKNREEGIFV